MKTVSPEHGTNHCAHSSSGYLQRPEQDEASQHFPIGTQEPILADDCCGWGGRTWTPGTDQFSLGGMAKGKMTSSSWEEDLTWDQSTRNWSGKGNKYNRKTMHACIKFLLNKLLN